MEQGRKPVRIKTESINKRKITTKPKATRFTRPERLDLGRSIVGLRNDLLAEHLGVKKAVLEVEVERAGGSLIRAIEALRSDGRSLVPFEPPELNAAEATLLDQNQLLDPEQTSSRWRSVRRWLRSLLSATRAD
ncbi:hypothetical protein [Salinihabitans flavidus]|uniref:hypothetical protein n=1 Tax=Salinihabitans flavidus TaxID=569882 RepID=UPI0011138558|nr:hypothetical protein [Salinihabitans flavidus]